MANISVRYKLLILVLLITIPMVLLQVWVVHRGYEDYTVNELQANLELAYAVEAAFSNYISDLSNSAKLIGHVISLEDFLSNDELVEQLLSTALASYPSIYNYAWVSPIGEILASTMDDARGMVIADRTYVQEIIKGKDLYVSNFFRSSSRAIPFVMVSRAIRGSDGELLGIVIMGINVEQLHSVLPTTRTGLRTIGLVDRQGTIVYRNIPSEMAIDQRKIGSHGPAAHTLATGEVQINRSFTSPVQGTTHMGVTVPVPDLGWVAYATAPSDEVMAVARQRMQSSMIVLGVITLLSLLAVSMISKGLIKGINELQHASYKVAKGDLQARAIIDGNDELAKTATVFNSMAERIAGLEESRKNFLQILAHELRNPMAAIMSGFSLIEQIYRNKPEEAELRPILAVMERELNRMGDLVREVANAFRVLGKYPIQHKDVYDFASIVESAMESFVRVVVDREFIVEGLIFDRYFVIGEERGLEDVVRNLVSNAVKYSGSGDQITLRLGTVGDDLLLSVEDNGIGISPEEGDKVFNGFYRSSNLKGNDPGGMGLGLTICKGIVEQHGGSIWFENKPAGGTIFYVRLPLDK